MCERRFFFSKENEIFLSFFFSFNRKSKNKKLQHTSSPLADVETKLAALDNHETTELVGVAVAVICTGPPLVETAGLEGLRLAEPEQAPERQSWPAEQALEHAPQLLLSVMKSTHPVAAQ